MICLRIWLEENKPLHNKRRCKHNHRCNYKPLRLSWLSPVTQHHNYLTYYGSIAQGAAQFATDLPQSIALMTGAGLPAPKTMAWPNNATAPQLEAMLASNGITYSRSNGPYYMYGINGINPSFSDGVVKMGTVQLLGQNLTYLQNYLQGLVNHGGTGGAFTHTVDFNTANWTTNTLGTDPSTFRLFLETLASMPIDVVYPRDVANILIQSWNGNY